MTLGKNPRSKPWLSRKWPGLLALAAGLWISSATSELPAPPGGAEPSDFCADAEIATPSQASEREPQIGESGAALSAARSVVETASIETAVLVLDPIDAAWFDWEFDSIEQQANRSSPVRRRGGASPFRRGSLRR
jgi:hypothetical protein